MGKEIDITDLAGIIKGRVIGNLSPNNLVNGTCAIDNYVLHKVSFVKNEKYSQMLGTLKGAIVLVNEDAAHLCETYPQNIYIIVKDVVNSIMDLQDFFYRDELSFSEVGISKKARIDSNATIGKDVFIDDNVIIGNNVNIGNRTKIMPNSVVMENVKIGERTIIYPGVVIYKNCQIGNDVILRSGVSIGTDGYRFEHDISNSKIRKMLQLGSVVIGDRVEIGCNSVICRGTFEGSATIISDDVKICDLVDISHNVIIGARTIIIALSTVAGSTKIGEDVWIGAGVSIANGLNVGNRAKILLNAVVAYDVAEDEIVSGFYAMPHKQWKRVYKILKEYG